MNDAIALVPHRIDEAVLDDFLALLALPSKRKSAKELPGYVANILEEVSSYVDSLLLRAIAAQGAEEFRRLRKELFPLYAKTVTSLAKLVRAIVPDAQIERAVDESFSELEADFRSQALERFGAAVKDQATFTVWTFRRTAGLIAKIIAAGPVPTGATRQDEELATMFNFYGTWAQFNLDCLLTAIRCDKPIQIDLLPEVIDGLRAAVNAYGYARQGLDLKVPRQEPIIATQEWDEEDQELLSSSMRDMEAEALND